LFKYNIIRLKNQAKKEFLLRVNKSFTLHFLLLPEILRFFIAFFIIKSIRLTIFVCIFDGFDFYFRFLKTQCGEPFISSSALCFI